jgi:hypothetical protein
MKNLWLSACLAFLGSVPFATADEPATPPAKQQAAAGDVAEIKFMRLARDDQGKLVSLDTAVARYESTDPAKKGTYVELVGAVHVGERSYYEALNAQFERYDALLYELVAPPNTRIPKGGGERSGNPVSAIQTGLKSVLGLEFQLEQVDYTKKNFVHADMSPTEFSEKMKEKNESFWTLFMRLMAQGMAQQAGNAEGGGDLALLTALFSKNREVRLKQMMAEQMENMEGTIEAIEGPDGSTILTERNKKALEVLRRELQSGKREIGIFYGAAHLPDMHKRLESEFGMRLVEHRWLPAWNLQAPETKRTPRKKRKAKQAEPAEQTEQASPAPTEPSP